MHDQKLFTHPLAAKPAPRRPTRFGMPSSWRGPEASGVARDIGVDVERQEDDVVLVRATGALNGHTYNRLIDTLRGLFEQGMYRMAIDLSGVQQMSSAGAAACAAAVGIAADNHGQVTLVTPSKSVRRFLHTLGIDQLAQVCNDVDTAIAQLRVN